MCILQGVTMLHVEAIPTTGFLKSSSLKPTARSMERLGARSAPSTYIEEYLLISSFMVRRLWDILSKSSAKNYAFNLAWTIINQMLFNVNCSFRKKNQVGL
jgi:hypothetical protein